MALLDEAVADLGMARTGVLPTVIEVLARVIGALPAIGKDHENREQGFKFQGIDDVVARLKPLAARHGLVIAPDVVERIEEKRAVGRDGSKIMHVVHLHVRYGFYGPAGDHIWASAWGEGSDMGDKSTAKAMTGAFKSVLRQILVVADQASTDGDSSTPEDTVARPVRDVGGEHGRGVLRRARGEDGRPR